MKRLILLVLPVCAWAGTADLSWTAPTQNTDGTAITLPLTYKVYGGVQGQSKTVLATVSARAYQHTTAPNGVTYCYHVTAVAGGQESAPSTEGCKAIPAAVPNPPGNLQITVQQTTAYYVIQQENRFVLLPAGTVPNGTSCDSSQQVNGYHVVPRDLVQWFGDVKPQAVVAACG